MAVKNLITGEIHKGTTGGKTGCGADTTDHPENWANTSASLTCDKNGCKN